jgi:Protein tyrosine and serine/threonine kinase
MGRAAGAVLLLLVLLVPAAVLAREAANLAPSPGCESGAVPAAGWVKICGGNLTNVFRCSTAEARSGGASFLAGDNGLAPPVSCALAVTYYPTGTDLRAGGSMWTMTKNGASSQQAYLSIGFGNSSGWQTALESTSRTNSATWVEHAFEVDLPVGHSGLYLSFQLISVRWTGTTGDVFFDDVDFYVVKTKCVLPSAWPNSTLESAASNGCSANGTLFGGSACSLQCRSGFVADSGTSDYVCLQGNFSATPNMTCTPAPCTLPASLGVGIVGASVGSSPACVAGGIVQSGQSCSVSCRGGYSGTGTTAYSCLSGTFTTPDLSCSVSTTGNAAAPTSGNTAISTTGNTAAPTTGNAAISTAGNTGSTRGNTAADTAAAESSASVWVFVVVGVVIAIVTLVVCVVVGVFLYQRRQQRDSSEVDSDGSSSSQRYSPVASTGTPTSAADAVQSQNLIRGVEIERELGAGQFGKVFLASYDGRQVAVKQILEQADDEFVKELEVMCTVRSDYIVEFLGAAALKDGTLGLVMEYCPNGSLDSMLPKKGPLMAQSGLRQCCLHIALGLKAVHDRGIIHREYVLKSHPVLCN